MANGDSGALDQGDATAVSPLRGRSEFDVRARGELLRWFRQRANSLADAYEGAARLVDEPGFPGRVHFVAHAVRDICDRLVFVLDPRLQPTRVQYEQHMDQIAGLWPIFDPVNPGDSGVHRETVELPRRTTLAVDALVREHQGRRARPSAEQLLFQFLMREEPLQPEVNHRVVSQLARVRRWFMERTHLRAKIPEVDEAEFRRKFRLFEVMLHSFVGSFFTGKKELDAILRDANKQRG